jgi:hypothetical protein
VAKINGVVRIEDCVAAVNEAVDEFWDRSFYFVLESIINQTTPERAPTGFGLAPPIITAAGFWTNATGWGDSRVRVPFLIQDVLKPLWFADRLASGIWVDYTSIPRGLLQKPHGPYAARRGAKERQNFQVILERKLLAATLQQKNKRRRGLWDPKEGKTVPEYRRKKKPRK